MFYRLLTALVLTAGLLAGAGVARAQSQPAASAEATVNSGAAKVANLVARKVRMQASKRDLQRTYEGELRELDRLKRGRGWNRDRQIASKKASSQATAEKLSRVDAELRALDKILLAWRGYLLKQVARELAGSPSAMRRTSLEKMRRELAALTRPPARKIILPDDSLDELADPDELAEQIALIEQAERELQRERTRLKSREDTYARVDRLRTQHDRAGQLSDLDDTDVRRTTGRPESSRSGNESGADSGGGAAGGDSADGEADSDDSGGEPAPADPGSSGDFGGESPQTDSGFEQSSIILADVVDSSTVDALKRAAGSSAKARASAASQARKQVDARLQRLARSRQLIQQHLARLRRR